MPKSINSGSFKDTAIKIAISSLIGLAVFVFIISVVALIFSHTPYPKENLLPYVLFSSAVSCFFSGFISARKLKKNGLVTGIISGIILTAVFYFIFAVFSSFSLSQSSLLLIPSCILPAAVSGILAVNIKHR